MFEEIIGNEQAKLVLGRLVGAGRIPQSLLFSGISGVGKRLFALELAKLLICQNTSGPGPCNVCSACKRASAFSPPRSEDKDALQQVVFTSHPDVGFILPFKQTILIDAIRDLEKEANYRPFEAGVRVFIIDDAEKLSSVKDNAANALLKTLEEPAESTHIILISSRPLLLLSTIRSRCQSVCFGPVEPQRIIDHLINSGEYASEDAALAAKLSRGSLGRALETDIQGFKEIRGKMLEIVKSCSRRENFAILLRTAEDLSDPKERHRYDESVDILQDLVHDIWTIHQQLPGKVVNFDILDELSRVANETEHEKVTRWLNEIEKLREGLNFNLNRKLATDALFLRMAG